MYILFQYACLLLLVLLPRYAEGQSILTTEESNAAARWLAEAIESDSPDDLLVGALISAVISSGPSKYDFFEKAIELEIDDSLTLNGLLSNCHRPELQRSCNLERIFSVFNQLDSENAVGKVYSALYQLRSDNTEQAFSELSLASNAQSFDDYFIRRGMRIREKLLEIDFPSDRTQALSFLFAADNLPEFYQQIIDACSDQGAKKSEWKELCIKLGELMEARGSTYISVRVGLAIQKDMYSLSESDAARLQEVERRRAFTHRWRVLAADTFEGVRSIVDMPDAYYEDLIRVDEIYAINQAFQRKSGVPDP